MNRSNRRIGTMRYGIPLILLLLLTGVGTAAAVYYVVLQFTVSVSVQDYPKVTFWYWAGAGEKRVNTFTYPVNIFPSIKTIDQNATYGVHCATGYSGNSYLRIYSMTTPGNIAELNVTIYDLSGTIFTKKWTSFSPLPTDWTSFTPVADKTYTIGLEITGSSGASGSSSIVFEIKVENP